MVYLQFNCQSIASSVSNCHQQDKHGICFRFLEENAIYNMTLTKYGNKIQANQPVVAPALSYHSLSQLVDRYPHELIVIGAAPPAILGQLMERGTEIASIRDCQKMCEVKL